MHLSTPTVSQMDLDLIDAAGRSVLVTSFSGSTSVNVSTLPTRVHTCIVSSDDGAGVQRTRIVIL